MSFEDALSFALQSLVCTFTLKAEKREVLAHLYRKKDIFAWLPTGYGKSLCYQLLPFLLSSSSGISLVLVISPLVSLMIDQVRVLRGKGVNAAILSNAAGKVEKSLIATEEDLSASRFLFCAPEAILCSAWRETIQRKDLSERIVAVAVDEAHCVSKWRVNCRK